MPWPRMPMPPLNWRQPWGWPMAYQRALFVCAAIIGICLLSPWWAKSWQAWDEALQAQEQLLAQQQATQDMREQTALLLQTQTDLKLSFVDTTALATLARQQGLQFSQLGVDKPLQTAALSALHIQQLPLHWQVQGSWEAWLNWLAQWPTSAPGVTVSSLELKADPRGGISAQVVAVAPQPTAHEASFALSSLSAEDTTATDPFNAQAWIHAQRMRAQQHPSYAKLVAPELLRPRATLEAFPRERLQYVGQIATGTDVEALVKVLPAAGGNKDPSMMTVHRVRVGGYLGHDFGRVIAISPDHLMLQELVLNATGEWLTREATLPLKDAAP